MSNTINNGVPEFPLPPVSHDGKVVALTEGVAHGMTLRDYFAAKAMKALMHEEREMSYDNIAAFAYAVADSMLRERGEA